MLFSPFARLFLAINTTGGKGRPAPRFVADTEAWSVVSLLLANDLYELRNSSADS